MRKSKQVERLLLIGRHLNYTNLMLLLLVERKFVYLNCSLYVEVCACEECRVSE